MLQASTAVNLGFMVFIAGWIMQVVIIFGYPYTPNYYGEVVVGTVLFTLLPWSVPHPPCILGIPVATCIASAYLPLLGM